MAVGRNIRFHRMKKSLTQEELATGLISISYLSKIENEQITASPEIIESLYRRLEIAEELINESSFIQELKEWYQCVADRKTALADETYDHLKHKIKLITSFDSIALFDLFTVRYFLTLGQFNEAELKLKTLSNIHKDFNKELQFFYYKFKGNFLYIKNQFNEAYEKYKSAESLIDSSFPAFERADIFYSLGLSASQLYKPYLAILYANQALDLFQKIYRRDKSAECHLLLGISYKRVKECDQAETHYKWASKLAEEVNYHSIKGLIEHNLGLLVSMQGNFEASVSHFNQSLQLKSDDNPAGKMITILAMLKIGYENKKQHIMKECIAEAEKYIHNLSSNSSHLFHEYKIFYFFIHEDYENFVFYLAKIAIPYFKKHSFYLLESQYAEILAEYYKTNRKYKQSSLYFEYAKNILKKNIINI